MIWGGAGKDCGIEDGVTALAGNCMTLSCGLGMSWQWVVHKGALGRGGQGATAAAQAGGIYQGGAVPEHQTLQPLELLPRRGQVSWAVEARRAGA